ncbi:MAG: hypothetical protein ACRCS6_10630 [Turicibacter sp.]
MAVKIFLKKENMMMALFNISSVVLGLIAWGLPIYNLMSDKKSNSKNWSMLSILSLSSCATAICFQLISINEWVNISDWTALLDTMNAVIFVSIFLLMTTIILNVFTWIIYRKHS